MPGFGSWPFGTGPFGEYHWSKHVLWKDLPEIDRRKDAEEADGRLETYTNAIKPQFDGLLWMARGFGDLRDPDLVRTQYQGVIDLNLLFAVPTASGRTIRALFEKTDLADPFNPLEDASIGWILKDQAGREYTVNSVHKLWDEGPMLELVGAAELPVSAFSQGTALTGVVQFTAGSTAVTGVGTAFLAEVAPGQYVAPESGQSIGLVESVMDNENLVLSKVWYGRTRSGPAVVADAADGAVTLRPPSLIEYLGGDFGIEVDRYEPESYQRSSVRDAKQWLIRKGAQRAYDIIGKISGFRVVAYPVWRLASPIPSWIPPETIFEIPPGSGHYYTLEDPFLPRFDDIAADVIPLDYACIETPDWTTEAITPPVPSPPDGTSVEEAIGFVMQNLPVLGSPVDLGGGRWRVQVGPGVDLWPIASIGQWYANWAAAPGSKFYLETMPVEVAAGVWEFELVAGETPVFGATLNIDYDCPLVMTCDFCRASVLRIEMTAAEILTEPGANLDDVLGRMARKIQQVIPIHVRVADIVNVVGPVQLSLDPTVQVSATVTP